MKETQLVSNLDHFLIFIPILNQNIQYLLSVNLNQYFLDLDNSFLETVEQLLDLGKPHWIKSILHLNCLKRRKKEERKSAFEISKSEHNTNDLSILFL